MPLVVVVRSHRQLRSVVGKAPDGFGQQPDRFHSDVLFLRAPLTPKQVLAVVSKYGGKFLVRGGRVESLEGGWAPKRVVALEFPSVEQAQKWYRSEEYGPLIALRQKASRGKLILVEGS